MKIVIVSLDGSEVAERILPDAERLAGDRGKLVLVHAVSVLTAEYKVWAAVQMGAMDISDAYLDGVAAKLRMRGVTVDAHTVADGDMPETIDDAADRFHGDILAIATHGRGPASRLVHGGIAWRAVAHSRIPVLIRHFDLDSPATEAPSASGAPGILVPLDGSVLAEAAIPLARELALQWNAEVVLVRVIPSEAMLMQASGWAVMAPVPVDSHEVIEECREDASEYLTKKSQELAGVRVSIRVLEGHVLNELVTSVRELGISDVVMTSHGRTGLSRMILGSVADGLIHRLHLPIVVVPALSVHSEQPAKQSLRPVELAAVG